MGFWNVNFQLYLQILEVQSSRKGNGKFLSLQGKDIFPV